MRGIATLKLGDFETSHTLGGASYTSRDIDLAVVARGWVAKTDGPGCMCERGEWLRGGCGLASAFSAQLERTGKKR